MAQDSTHIQNPASKSYRNQLERCLSKPTFIIRRSNVRTMHSSGNNMVTPSSRTFDTTSGQSHVGQAYKSSSSPSFLWSSLPPSFGGQAGTERSVTAPAEYGDNGETTNYMRAARSRTCSSRPFALAESAALQQTRTRRHLPQTPSLFIESSYCGHDDGTTQDESFVDDNFDFDGPSRYTAGYARPPGIDPRRVVERASPQYGHKSAFEDMSSVDCHNCTFDRPASHFHRDAFNENNLVTVAPASSASDTAKTSRDALHPNKMFNPCHQFENSNVISSFDDNMIVVDDTPLPIASDLTSVFDLLERSNVSSSTTRISPDPSSSPSASEATTTTTSPTRNTSHANLLDDTNDGVHDKQWKLRYRELLRYRAEYGNCAVPYDYEPNDKLTRWVKRQRYQGTLKRSGRRSSLTDEREFLLNDIGFVWDSQRAAWEEKWNELLDYKREFGHCGVPSRYSRNRPLAAWVKCQRRQHKLGKLGQLNTLTNERRVLLDKLGFVWNPKNLP